MAERPTYTVEEARRLLPTVRSALLRIALDRREGNDDAAQLLLDHLGELGVVVRDLEAGLVDIPTEREGKPAWLCWRLADPDLGWWHTTREGFASRRPL